MDGVRSLKKYLKWSLWAIGGLLLLSVIMAGIDLANGGSLEAEEEKKVVSKPVEKVESTVYKITNKEHNDSGQTYLTIEVETDDLDTAREIVEGIVKDPYDATGYDATRAPIESLHIQIYKPGDKLVWVNVRAALSQKGIAQTGLEKVNEIEFEEYK